MGVSKIAIGTYIYPIIYKLKYITFKAANRYFLIFTQIPVFPLKYEEINIGIMDWIKILIDY